MLAGREHHMTISCKDSRELRFLHACPEVSILSPVYMGEESVLELVDRVRQAVERVTNDYEIILVEDGSPDGSWQRIESACRKDRRVKGIRLSRNFGQNYAITAGLAAARGNYVVVLDCDLQDDPMYIPDLYWAAQKGADIVYTRKQRRHHSGARNAMGRSFQTLFNLLVGTRALRTESVIGSYSLLSRRAVDACLSFKEYHRHYLGILRRLGFDATSIDIEHRDRPHGKSSYSVAKLLRLAIDIITSETDRLLYLSIGMGLGLVAIAFIAAVYIIIAYFTHGFREGWASVFVLILTSTGAILTSLGITGVYVGKIFEQTKNRPLFIVRDKLNFPNDPSAEATGVSSERDRHLAVENA
jgi:dolichol-phosphate mannosyltransferase